MATHRCQVDDNAELRTFAAEPNCNVEFADTLDASKMVVHFFDDKNPIVRVVDAASVMPFYGRETKLKSDWNRTNRKKMAENLAKRYPNKMDDVVRP